MPLHHSTGLGHIEFHLTVDRSPTYFVNIARAICMLTYFGVYTGAMNVDEVEGRGTVSFVLSLTVITFKYSIMTGDNTPMPPALLEETQLDNFMDTGFNLLCLIIFENMVCGWLISLSSEEDGNPGLFDLSMEHLRIVDLIFYALVTIFWTVYCLAFFWHRHKKQKKKQKERNEAEKKPVLDFQDNGAVSAYYKVDEAFKVYKADGAANSEQGLLAENLSELSNILEPKIVFQGDVFRPALKKLTKEKSWRKAGPACQSFPFSLTTSTVECAQRNWLIAENPMESNGLTLPAWSDEATLEYVANDNNMKNKLLSLVINTCICFRFFLIHWFFLIFVPFLPFFPFIRYLLFAIRAAHLPGTFYKEIALRLLARIYDDGPQVKNAHF